MLRFGLIPFTVFPDIGIPLLFQVIHQMARISG